MAILTDYEKHLYNESGPAAAYTNLGDMLETLLSETQATVSVTLGDEATNAIACTIQCYSALRGSNRNHGVKKLTWWLSDTEGAAPTGSAPSGGTTVETGTSLKEHTANVFGDALTDSNGVLALEITEETAKSFFLNVLVGSNLVSTEVAFA